MRASVHFGLVASLLLAFAQAPFDHTHESDPHHEHAEGLMHAHTHGETGEPDGQALEAPDHDGDAHFSEWFSFEEKPQVRFLALLPMAPMAAKPGVAICASVADFAPRNHDPPWLRLLQPRAPPA